VRGAAVETGTDGTSEDDMDPCCFGRWRRRANAAAGVRQVFGVVGQNSPPLGYETHPVALDADLR
jgi:hypothetical protein